jgi:hypothetical protein
MFIPESSGKKIWTYAHAGHRAVYDMFIPESSGKKIWTYVYACHRAVYDMFIPESSGRKCKHMLMRVITQYAVENVNELSLTLLFTKQYLGLVRLKIIYPAHP